MSLSADILVPAGRFGAKIQELDLLHAGVHHAAVFMCQPLLPWCQVKDKDRKEEPEKNMTLTDRNTVEDYKKEGKINSLHELDWGASDT